MGSLQPGSLTVQTLPGCSAFPCGIWSGSYRQSGPQEKGGRAFVPEGESQPLRYLFQEKKVDEGMQSKTECLPWLSRPFSGCGAHLTRFCSQRYRCWPWLLYRQHCEYRDTSEGEYVLACSRLSSQGQHLYLCEQN